MRKALVVLLAVCGCGVPLPSTKPAAPDANDATFTVEGVHAWYLVGNAATPGSDELEVAVTAPDGTTVVDVWVGDLPPQRLSLHYGHFLGTVAIGSLSSGSYDVLLSADGKHTAFARVSFTRSAPYYVLVSTDWDFSDPSDPAIADMDAMHVNHPELVMTHFVGPYTFTDPAVTAARAATITTWVLEQRDTFHDEVGLHIHPYCNFVTHAGVTCVTDQSTVYPGGDLSGYTIKLGAYGRTNMATLLTHASDLFAQNGLNRPKTFRAGGWTATLDTLGALADTGFIADTSALNWARIEEWKGYELYRWTQENWGPITDTTQPYWPGATSAVMAGTPPLGLLEVPDNGVMIDYVSLAEMTGLFDSNWAGGALDAPRTLMMGFHPSKYYSADENGRVEGFLTYADQHLASRDLGPVVYVTLSGVTPAFPR
jgi:hypothetical protein